MCPASFCQVTVPGKGLAGVRQAFGKHLANFDKHLASIRQASGKYQTNIRQVSGKYQTSVRQVSDKFPASALQVLIPQAYDQHANTVIFTKNGIK